MEVDEDGRAPEARWPWGWHVPFGTGYPNSWMVYDGRPYITLLKWMIWGTPILGDNHIVVPNCFLSIINCPIQIFQ